MLGHWFHIYDRFKNTDEWYKFYVNFLGNVGSVIQKVKFEEYNTSGLSLQVSTAILDIFQGILTENELEVAKRTLESLKTSGYDDWWNVFDRKSSGPSKNGNFQITPSKEDHSGPVIMSLGTFYFNAIHFFKGTQISTLN